MKKIIVFVVSILFLNVFVCSEEKVPPITVLIPMRDGTELPTDLYMPTMQKQGVRLPVILIRSPAGRHAPFTKPFIPMIHHGYIVAIQDTRSAMDTEGKTFPYWSDGWGKQQDGYDTVEWLAKCEYCDGKVGTIGMSALGISQLMMAPTAPPSLRCQYIGVAASSLYHDAAFHGGQMVKEQVEGWLNLYANDCGVFTHTYNQPFYNEFWDNFNTNKVADRVQAPAIFYGGWYDTFIQGTINAYKSRQENGGEGARGKQKLVIGPWTHHWPLVTTLGDFDIPEAGKNLPPEYSPLLWFDFYLKGKTNGIESLSPVMYFTMGPLDGSSSSGNVWQKADQWPVPHEATPLYLVDQERLSFQKSSSEGSVAYEYDPQIPIMTKGGRNLFLFSGPSDQREIEERSDVVIFTSELMKEDVEVTGEVVAKIFFSSSHEDTDVVVRLTDVYPDGKSILIADGVVRTGIYPYLSDCEHPGVDCPMELDIDLFSTSIVFAKGHKIRVSISSSSFPRYERNFNIGVVGGNLGHSMKAKNKILFGKEHPSQVILPIVRQVKS